MKKLCKEKLSLLRADLERRLYKNNSREEKIDKIISWLKEQDEKEVEEKCFIKGNSDSCMLWRYLKEDYFHIPPFTLKLIKDRNNPFIGQVIDRNVHFEVG